MVGDACHVKNVKKALQLFPIEVSAHDGNIFLDFNICRGLIIKKKNYMSTVANPSKEHERLNFYFWSHVEYLLEVRIILHDL